MAEQTPPVWPADEPDPRWSLANERTLLAYNRTALALVVAGLAVSGSHVAVDVPAPLAALGLPLIVTGAAVALTSRRRYFEVRTAMEEGRPLPAATVATALPFAIFVVAAVAAIVAAAQLG